MPRLAEEFSNWGNRLLGAFQTWEGLAVSFRNGTADHNDWHMLRMLAGMLRQLSDEMKLGGSEAQFRFLEADIHEGKFRDASELATRVENTIRTFRDELQDYYFFRIELAKKAYLAPELWSGIAQSFPSALEDAREASACFVLGRNTASVFHAMRCVEFGLRALAKERGFRPKKGPIEWQDWWQTIKGISDEVNAEAGSYTKGPRKDAFLEFYNGALREFQGFKDEFRNYVSHTRGTYSEAKAAEVLNDMRRFMSRLVAGGLTESGKKIRWRRK